jgi:tetratricopeptide (TPR) repeat protein
VKEDAEKFKQANMDKAKKMLGEAIVPKIGNAANEQVEVLIQQLCSMMAPKRRRPSTLAAAPPAPAADGTTPTPAPDAPPPPPPGPTFEEVEKELEGLISPPETAMNGTAQMRILFARSWLARIMREQEKAEKVFSVIIEVARPDDLSPLLLGTVGDNARKKGDLAKAEACYKRLMEIFPNSEFADAAPVGLAEIAYQKGEFDRALELFQDATGDKYQGSSRLLEAMLGKGRTLVQLKKFDGDDGAFKLYEVIAQTKEWRGEATAESLFMLGEIERMRGFPAKAIPYYQRVFIAHQKWKSWVARAYLECAKAFVALNRPANPEETDPALKRERSDKEAAKMLLQEMLKREDLKNETKAVADAQAELGKLGG